MKNTIDKIAKDVLGIDILKTNSLHFEEVGVLDLRRALEKAYEAGQLAEGATPEQMLAAVHENIKQELIFHTLQKYRATCNSAWLEDIFTKDKIDFTPYIDAYQKGISRDVIVESLYEDIASTTGV